MICAALPRERFVHLPTPLEAAPRLSAALGVEVLVKREDLAGLCAGGNKARLLEFAIGAVREQGADTLIACAAAQSNKLREIAAAAARCGLHAVLLVPGETGTAPPQGNRLLLDLLGAQVRPVRAGLDEAGVLAAQESVREELVRAGRRPAIFDRRLDYGVHATAAYVDAAEELLGQLAARSIDAEHVYVTVGAGMTAAGIALGLKHLGARARVTGVCVARNVEAVTADIVSHAGRAAAHLGLSTNLLAGDLTLTDRFVGAGYGIVTPALVDAVRTVARCHGIVLDPVYNAKTALALLEHAAGGEVAPGTTVVLFDTGGAPGIFPHHVALAGAGGASFT